MNSKTTFSRRMASFSRSLHCAVAALWFFSVCEPAQAVLLSVPDQLIGVTQGFLEFAVEDYQATTHLQGRYQIEVNTLDPRLTLPQCDKELTASLESPAQPIGRVTVKVRCEGTLPWTVYVPAQVHLFRQVVIVKRPLKRSSIIGEDDVYMAERDISQMPQGYMTSIDDAIGQKMTRQMINDQILTPLQLEQAEVIRKGDQVIITAKSGTLQVRMPGEALSDGAMSEQIRVRNLNSQRVIKARVTAPGQVEVAL
ncbi:flagellar basal body P-ring formation chaperone FlgA [Pseudomonas sp. 10B1]|uniref:flagellar basal body P-ring formation chaperone FlgA n=1 Tax=unclassified Pseudomonas TaxID=196821 RepID=UPI002AB3391E|nr:MULTISPECIES: flagellar basal body P-ring formation chaperone FlgA [unclassified Pseudomonas]MDY7560783.1 flagellar basal body P-ring formation chaperone FlgA [Pseudomonas sp. AB6]MEA9996866.1 flagellar basal body P-ring formation chaperone FlgA [Pseudomonas sp. AA4]MEB0087301.1 flagellar basal body P-ring formation chaperone FlgA [Pseudomonas sp. RTI1]MEB0128088.1 flagellar basal body P-ring formation chaperone FlgA [Pseudomonas sp. CCC1.2]MEB0154571.1 flagellar basal body P-ring formation